MGIAKSITILSLRLNSFAYFSTKKSIATVIGLEMA